MHIAHIQIENFRLFKELSLELNPGLNVVVGENNSGKTALIDAVRITLDTNSAEWTRISESDFYADSTSFKIRLKFDDIAPEQAYVFVEHLTHEKVEEGRRKSVLYVNLIAHRTDVLRRGTPYIRTELRSGEIAEGPAIEREIRDYLSATYLKPLRDAEAELSAGRGSRLAQILSASKMMKDGGNYKKLLTDFITASQQAKSNPGISESRDSINNHFEKLTFEDDKQNFDLAVQISSSTDFARMSQPEKARAFQDILARLSLVLDEATPRQGLGYNNILFMATELILLEQDAGQFPLLLIEEPEAHLHPQLQMKFLKFVRDEYSVGDTPTLQTILSTHSPNLASKAPLDCIIVMKDGKAFPMRKNATRLDKDDYEFLEKFLDVTKANLFFAKGVLIVEGDAESIVLPTIAKLLGRPLENYGVSVVNVGNTAYARYAKIFLRDGADKTPDEWLPVKVACLRDLDLWPAKADKNSFPEIGFKEVTDRNRHFWERRADENGEIFGTDPNVKTARLKKFASPDEQPNEQDGNGVAEAEPPVFVPQNINVCVSEKWTFEYCLIRSGLAAEVYEALKGSRHGFDELPAEAEEKAIKIYGMIENKSGAKTDVAYKLSSILQREFSAEGKKEDLKNKLPPYILSALEHVTNPWPENLDAEPKPPAGQRVAVPMDQADERPVAGEARND